MSGKHEATGLREMKSTCGLQTRSPEQETVGGRENERERTAVERAEPTQGRNNAVLLKADVTTW